MLFNNMPTCPLADLRSSPDRSTERGCMANPVCDERIPNKLKKKSSHVGPSWIIQQTRDAYLLSTIFLKFYEQSARKCENTAFMHNIEHITRQPRCRHLCSAVAKPLPFLKSNKCNEHVHSMAYAMRCSRTTWKFMQCREK